MGGDELRAEMKQLRTWRNAKQFACRKTLHVRQARPESQLGDVSARLHLDALTQSFLSTVAKHSSCEDANEVARRGE